MKFSLLFIGFSIAITGCASKEVRTKFSDRRLRVLIDPDSISADHHIKIAAGLMKTGRFIVVDRNAGFLAIKKEQERLHRKEIDRFADREKFAHWGKLYGVGGIVVAYADCHHREGVFTGRYKRCKQQLGIYDANTAELITIAEAESDGDAGDETVSWDEVSEKLADGYPKYFEKNQDTARLDEYKALSQEEATRQKEAYSRELLEIGGNGESGSRLPSSRGEGEGGQ